ncbi:MAG: hypothetical protein ACI9SG_000693 [Maribacter sp.]|jgi:hypothetical protein
MDSFFNHFSNKSLLTLFIVFIAFLGLYWTVLLVLRKLGKDPKYLAPKRSYEKIIISNFYTLCFDCHTNGVVKIGFGSRK